MASVTAPTATPQSQSPAEFVKAMTLTDATMLVAGSMIGSGIFIVSADIARKAGSPGFLLLAWLLTGVITVLGALAYGELAAMYPKAGGQYVFLRESMGPLMGFLYGWTLFTIIQTGTIAAVAVGFGKFLGVLWPAITPDRFSWFPSADACLAALGCTDPANAIKLGLSPQRLVALITIVVLSWINLRGIREGKFVQTTLTSLKAVSLVLLILVAISIGRNADAIAANFSGGHFWGSVDVTSVFVITFGAAFVGSLFSADAWNNVTFAAAEVENPQRNLPLSLLLGTGLVCLLYFLANVGYLNTLPMMGDAHGVTALARGISGASEDRVATAAMEVAFGSSGATIMAIAILISTFGCNNGLILAGARVYYAMAQDKLFFRSAAVLNKNKVPAVALVLQSVWTAILCLSGTYGQLLDYVIFAGLVFYVLTTVGLFMLRSKKPDMPRPYKAVGYPFLPLLYIALAGSVMVLIMLAPTSRSQAIAGLVLVVIGIPVYFVWKAMDPSRPAAVSSS